MFYFPECLFRYQSWNFQKNKNTPLLRVATERNKQIVYHIVDEMNGKLKQIKYFFLHYLRMYGMYNLQMKSYATELIGFREMYIVVI